jgi:hypothetical protein
MARSVDDGANDWQPPNPRLQRTRLRSPLSRQPFGAPRTRGRTLNVAIAGTFLMMTAVLIGGQPNELSGVDVSGYYLLNGQIPKAFRQVRWVELWMTDEAGKPKPLEGAVFLGSSDRDATRLPLVAPRLDGDRLRFETTALKGISFSFSGRFVRLGTFWNDAKSDELILKGHLVKLRAGKHVTEVDVEFTFSAGD